MDKAKLEAEVSYVGARLREPSTYAGLAVICIGLHVADAATVASTLTAGGMFLGGLIAMFLPDPK